MKHNKILGSLQPNTIRERFKIIGSLLSGKKDVKTGSTHGGIADDTNLSAASIKSFLNILAKEGFVNKEYVPASSGPVCFIGNAAHNEYTLNKKGIAYVKTQITLWMKTADVDQGIVDMINKMADSYVEPKKNKSLDDYDDYFMLTSENYIGKIVSPSLIRKYKFEGVTINCSDGMYSITFDWDKFDGRKFFHNSKNIRESEPKLKMNIKTKDNIIVDIRVYELNEQGRFSRCKYFHNSFIYLESILDKILDQ